MNKFFTTARPQAHLQLQLCPRAPPQVFDDPTVMLAATSRDIPRTVWLLDSGANVSIVNSLDGVTEARKLELDVGTADGNANMQVCGEVTVKLPLLSPDGETQTNLIIKDCLYIPTS